MRIVAAAIFILAIMTAPASAQSGGGGKHNHGSDDKKTTSKPKVDEKAYKAALDRIPEPKEKYDPWGVARPKPASKPN
jgi:hypothetical protein